MHLKPLLCPAGPRFLPGQRRVSIMLRTPHRGGIAALGGGFFYPSEVNLWRTFFDLTVWSGVVLAAIAI